MDQDVLYVDFLPNNIPTNSINTIKIGKVSGHVVTNYLNILQPDKFE